MTPEEQEKQQKLFDAAARPLIEYIAQNWHPHTTVIVNCTQAELLEGSIMFGTDEYLRD